MPCIVASAVVSRRRLQGRLLLCAVAKGNFFLFTKRQEAALEGAICPQKKPHIATIHQKTRGDNLKGALYCGKCGRRQAAPSRPPPALRGCKR